MTVIGTKIFILYGEKSAFVKYVMFDDENSMCLLWLTGHGLKFKTKAEAKKAQESKRDAEIEMEKNGSPPQSLQHQTTILQEYKA